MNSLNPVVMLLLFIAHLLALALTLSVLILAYWQQTGDSRGQAVTQFLTALGMYNLSVMLSMAVMFINSAPNILRITAILSIATFALTTISAYSLIVSMAGMMKQAYQVLARAGVLAVLLIQVPLWTDKFFAGDAPYYLMATFAPAGIVSALVALLYIALTLWIMWIYRQRIDVIVMIGIILLMVGQLATVFNVTLREIGVASLMSVAASALLGYRLARMQLFNPLLMHMAQFSALRDLSQALIGPHDVQQVLNAAAQQSRRMLNTDLALIIVRSDDGDEPTLTVGAQDGWTTNLVGRRLAVGSGLSGRVFESKTPMRLQNYHAWEGQTSAFADVPLKAALSIPLLYDDAVVGVLTAGELKLGRVFTERDQAMLEPTS